VQRFKALRSHESCADDDDDDDHVSLLSFVRGPRQGRGTFPAADLPIKPSRWAALAAAMGMAKAAAKARSEGCRTWGLFLVLVAFDRTTSRR